MFRPRLTLRISLTLVMAVVIISCILSAGYFMMRDAQGALLEEKQNKLFAYTRMLDADLTRTFDQILESKGLRDAPREEKIRALNRELSADTDLVAGLDPGVGVGYYSRELDAIITYGPSSQLGQTVGQSIAPSHLGRQVMSSGTPLVQTGPLVRGNIMNCMTPIIRDGEVIGYIWANELIQDIDSQFYRMENRFYLVIFISILLSFLGSGLIADNVVSKVNRIKNGLKRIQNDLNHRIPPMSGEIGEISEAINEMAEALSMRNRMMEQMQRADRLAMVGEIAAGVAHEIRNPLTSIKGFVQFLEEDLELDDPKLEYTRVVVKEVDRANKIVSQLLYYARPSESHTVLADINQVLENTLVLVNFKMFESKVVLNRRLKPGLPLIPVDEEQMKQVFINLILNAAQSIEGEGEITVETGVAQDGGLVWIVIRDSGVGIGEEDLKKVFDPFFTTREKGTGLGLSVAQKIVEGHGGFIEVASSPGVGSEFAVFLPIGKEGLDEEG